MSRTEMRELLARAAGEAKRVPGAATVVLGAPVPAAPVERFLRAAVGGERALIAPGAKDALAVAGLGAAARVAVPEGGKGRFARARDRARALFASVVRIDEGEVPPPRLLGGFSFAEEPAREVPWEGFGAADFVLPRWTYFVREGAGFLRLAAAPGELRASERILEELSAIEAALAAEEPPTVPGTLRVDEGDREAWVALVRAALSEIAAGRLEKVVPARRLRAVAEAGAFDPVAVVADGNAAEPGATRFLFEREGTAFVGRTPERLVQLAGGRIRCDALAGSIPRGDDDHERMTALLASEKDRREHDLVVRGIVEDLAWFADLGDVSRPPRIRTLRTVHHLHTPLEGTVRGTPHLFELAAALHPTAAVAGRPRARAVAFLKEREGLDRGWYAAPVGWVDGDGEGELFVALRSAALRGGVAWAYAGAGVVAGSDPGAEWRETGAKAASILDALGSPT
jgi:isochorismate synthase